MDRPTREEIAHHSQELKTLVLAQQLSLVAIADPSLPVLRAHQALTGVGPNADIPLDLTGGPGVDGLRFSMREVLTAASRMRGDVMRDAMSMSMRTAAIGLGGMIKDGGHSRGDVPLLQFARHLRNACAHGDRWNLTQGEPKTPASCRHFTLTSEHHGQRATWTTVSPLLFVHYLDDLSNYFVPGLAPVPQPLP